MKNRRHLNDFGSYNNSAKEIIPLRSVAELLGDKRVLVENHRGVCVYCCDKIVINVSYGKLCVSGDNLMLAYMAKNQLVITGCISSISIQKGE